MIVYNDEDKDYVSVDIGRPDMLDEAQMERWAKFQSYVKVTHLKIVVNNAYPVMDGLIQASQYYSGDGHSYRFWLESKEDLKEFVEQLEEIFGNVRSTLRERNPKLDLEIDT